MSEHTYTLSRRGFVSGAALMGLAGMGLILIPSPAFGVTAAEKQAEAAAVLETLNSLHDQADVLAAQYGQALADQQAAQDKMDDAQQRIDEKNAEIADLQQKLGNRARSMYRDGSFTFLDMLLGATTFQAFASNWDLLNDINKDDETMVQQTKDLRTEVEEEKKEYANQEKIAKQKADEAAQAKSEADALIAQTQEIYDNLSAEAAELLRQEEEAREAAARAAAEEAARRAAQQAQQSSGGSSGGGSSSGGSSSGGGSVNNGKPQTVTGNVVVDRAYSQIGKPYAWGACGPDSFDCSGLVSYCLSGSYGVRVGTTYTFMGWTRVSDPQPGDICTNDHHCGIYIGGGMMIHAPHTGAVVQESAVHSGMIFVRY